MNILRLKRAGAEVTEFRKEDVVGFEVFVCDCCTTYRLSMIMKYGTVDIMCGTFDECHLMLNKLHEKLGITVEDI